MPNEASKKNKLAIKIIDSGIKLDKKIIFYGLYQYSNLTFLYMLRKNHY